MIVNIYEAKSEALLFVCNEIIEKYSNYEIDLDLSDELIEYINTQIINIQNYIKIIIQDGSYYLSNQNVSRIKYIVKYITFLEKELNINLEKNQLFNPSMLIVSLLTIWFKEYEMMKNSKTYVYFLIYPYWEFFDKVFIECNNKQFIDISKHMLKVSEKVLKKYKGF